MLFSENEPIGLNYIVYKFRTLFKEVENAYCSCRLVAYKGKVKLVVCTLDNGLLKCKKLPRNKIMQRREVRIRLISQRKVRKFPKGQKVIPNFIIYRVLGQPEVGLKKWKLKLNGLIENVLEPTYDQLLAMSTKKIIRDFHHVTRWSVKRISWERVPLKYLASKAKVAPKAKRVHVHALDGYSTITPLEDFISEDSLLVLKNNDKPLTLEQGFLARIFIPHLYGWKGAKWVSTIIFRKHYVDGYWEALGHQERGNVWFEEMFKV